MQTTIAPETSLVLKGGFIAPVEALQLLWHLEDAGYQVHLDGTDLVVSPGSRLTRQQRLDIRRHKTPLIALVQYVDKVIA